MSKTTKASKLASFAFCAALALGAIGVAGCSPSSEPPADGGDKAQTEEVSEGKNVVLPGTMMMDFLKNTSGDFPDNVTTTDFLNAGNRGCNACHEDLFEIMGTLEPDHIIVSTGYGKKGTVFDCFGCHSRHVAETGVYLGDLLHGAHYSNEVFVEGNGNCWSCHAVSTEQTYARHDYDFLLWEDIKYKPNLGGYVDGGQAYNEWWVKAREAKTGTGWGTGFINGISVDVEPSVTMVMDQRVTATEDAFICNNFICDFEAVSSTEFGFEVSGFVNEPKKFTYEEILAMPQTTKTVTQTCSTNGLGGSLISNLEMTGVSMMYIIEQCGGLTPECNKIKAHTVYDIEQGWETMSSSVEWMWEDILIAYEMNGEPLGPDWGALMYVVPGHPAGAWAKHIDGLVCMSEEGATFLYDPQWSGPLNPNDNSTHFFLNAGWFGNDGETFTMAEGVDLSGWGFGWTNVMEGLEIVALKVSFDYGETWTTFEIPADHDPLQWTAFDLHWDPPAPGTYIAKLDAVNANGDTIKGPIGCANIIINVTE